MVELQFAIKSGDTAVAGRLQLGASLVALLAYLRHIIW